VAQSHKVWVAAAVSVALVGAGPGDPGLITVGGLELVRSCDALVHDALVAPELVAEAPEDALVISREGMNQQQVNDLIVRLGRAGLDVVRLKGGDPFVFGRGGEEALALAEAGIPFEIVPGVSSIAAVPAAALVPVTHRGVADTVTIASGRGADGGEPDYGALVAGGGTIVLFMALARLALVADGLISAGLAADTPAAVVSRGTLPDQQTATARLDEIAAAAEGLPSPALLVVGHVVSVAETLRAAQPAVDAPA
jgi:uroporphyrin-III C-methyltransferase